MGKKKKKKILTGPLKYHGGKSYLAAKIVAMMPKHRVYVEPYAGGAAVLLRKDPEGVNEIINDIHPGLAAFWSVMGNAAAFEQFYRMVYAKPFSEREWNHADATYKRARNQLTEIELAAMFFLRCRQSMSGRGETFAPVSRNRIRAGMNEQASAWITCLKGLPEVSARMQRVLVLNQDALAVLRRYGRSENRSASRAGYDARHTLCYLDPTYLPSTRVSPKVYEHDMTVKQHEALLKLIKTLDCKVMISGYPSHLYRTQLKDWNHRLFKIPNHASKETEKRTMNETVWTNF